jgi:hypothetical protein
MSTAITLKYNKIKYEENQPESVHIVCHNESALL